MHLGLYTIKCPKMAETGELFTNVLLFQGVQLDCISQLPLQSHRCPYNWLHAFRVWTNRSDGCCAYALLICIFHRPAETFPLHQESLSEDNRSFAPKVRQLSHKVEGPGSLLRGKLSTKWSRVLASDLMQKRINFYCIWTLVFCLVWYNG